MCVRADQNVIPEGAGIPTGASEHRILHHDAMLSYANWRALGGDDRAG
jgi:hypothetical protein